MLFTWPSSLPISVGLFSPRLARTSTLTLYSTGPVGFSGVMLCNCTLSSRELLEDQCSRIGRIADLPSSHDFHARILRTLAPFQPRGPLLSHNLTRSYNNAEVIKSKGPEGLVTAFVAVRLVFPKNRTYPYFIFIQRTPSWTYLIPKWQPFISLLFSW